MVLKGCSRFSFLAGLMDPSKKFLTTKMISKSRLKEAFDKLNGQLKTFGQELCTDENSAYVPG